jgi:simple sugar transport system permease protein
VIVGGVFIRLSGADPFQAYAAMARGAVGGWRQMGDSLAKATPMILSGLAVAFAFRGGLFNIGVEGQLYLGAIAAAWAGCVFGFLGWPIHLLATLVLASCAGAAWAALPGWLKAARNAHEVITTIMMNFIALCLARYLVLGPLREAGEVPQTALVAPSAWLPRLGEHSTLTIGILIALAVAAGFARFFGRSALGYEIQAAGSSPGAAALGGISVRRRITAAMAWSGAIAGILGAVEVLGVHRRMPLLFSPGYGFDGIAVALLGRNSAVGTVVAGLFFGLVRSGAVTMEIGTNVSRDIVIVIEGVVILFACLAGTWHGRPARGSRGTGESGGWSNTTGTVVARGRVER